MCGPTLVDRDVHTADMVGDESLCHAAVAPTWVARARRRGIEAAAASGASVVLLDDGLQQRTVEPCVSFMVLRTPHALGNGRLLPAGPLREPLVGALLRTDAVIVISDDDHAPRTAADGLEGLWDARLRARAGRPQLDVLAARVRLDGPTTSALAGRRVVTFASIAEPEPFVRAVQAACAVVPGGVLLEHHSFPDHYAVPAEELLALEARAAALGAVLVTTAKDAARFGTGPWPVQCIVAVARVDWSDGAQTALKRLLAPALRAAGRGCP